MCEWKIYKSKVFRNNNIFLDTIRVHKTFIKYGLVALNIITSSTTNKLKVFSEFEHYLEYLE